MASLSKQPNGRGVIQFTAETGKRYSIRVGKISQRKPKQLKTRVERILEPELPGNPSMRTPPNGWAN